MNIIFLDIDGVLNNFHTLKRNISNYEETGNWEINIDENKIELLSKIVEVNNAKIVLSSSWKINWDEDNISKDLLSLFKLFKKYNIECIGRTPNIKNGINTMWKDYDILAYLCSHPEVEHFCIIDDEDYDISILNSYLVKTEDYTQDEFKEGLLEEHREEIKRILTK